MPIFHYEGRNLSGIKISGTRVAQSADALSLQLQKDGVIPIHIELHEDKPTLWETIKEKVTGSTIKKSEMGLFARQMYTLTKTGVPISSALKHLADNIDNYAFSKALQGIVEDLEGGQDLASAMQNYPRVFDNFMVSMVQVGQNSGQLPEAFLRITQHIELEESASKNLKSALRYPIFVIVALVAAIILINVFVIPSFAYVFSQSKVPLPTVTVVLISVSAFFVKFWLVILIACVSAFLAFYYYIQTEKGRYEWDKFILRIPIIGKLLQQIVLLRFSQSFAITIDSGISLIDSIALIANSVDNEYAKQRILSMRESIERGNNLSQAAAATNLFSPIELQMLNVSEQTGEIGNMLKQIAGFYRREVDYNLKKIGDFVEPVLIVVLSAIILVLALAVYLPVWNMAQVARSTH